MDMRAQHTDRDGSHLLTFTHMQSDTPFVSHVHAGVPIGNMAGDSRFGDPTSWPWSAVHSGHSEQHGKSDRDTVGEHRVDMRAQHTDRDESHLLRFTHMQSDTPFVSHAHAGVPTVETHNTRRQSNMIDNRKGGPNSPPAPAPGAVAEGPWAFLGAQGGAHSGTHHDTSQGTQTPRLRSGQLTTFSQMGKARHPPRSTVRTTQDHPDGKHLCHLVTYNAGGLPSGRLRELLRLAEEHRVGVLCLQGTRWTSTGTLQMGHWQVHSSGATQGYDGVVICVWKQAPLRARVHQPGRLLEVRGDIFGCPMVILSAYAPGSHHPDSDRQAFWRLTDTAVRDVARRYQLWLAGDFNAHLGLGRSNQWVGDVGAESGWNPNGEALWELATRRTLAVVNTKGSPSACEWTWSSPDGLYHTRIDYILVRGTPGQAAQKVGPHPYLGFERALDHRPVSAWIPLTRLHRRGPRPHQVHSCNRVQMRTDYAEHDRAERAHLMGIYGPRTEPASRAEHFGSLVGKCT